MKFQKNSLVVWYNYQEKKRLQKLSKELLHKMWFQAIYADNLKKMKLIYSTGQFSIDIVDEYGWTALMYAAGHNNVNMATWLLQAEVDLNIFHQMIIHKDGSFTRGYYGSAFTRACASSSLQVAQLLYATGKIDVFQINDSFLFARGYEMVKWLMKIGANIKGKDDEGRSAFLLACRRFSLQVAQLLFDTGEFKIDEVDYQGNNALLNAIYLPGDKESKSSVLRDRWYNQLQIVSWLIELGIDVTHKNNEGSSAFMIVARHSVHLLELLYATKKININEQDNQGYSALMYAMPHRVQAVQKLLLWGADISLRNKQGQTALTYALQEEGLWKNHNCQESKTIISLLSQAQSK